jgi:CheY-like chemotaxis protein
MGTVSVLVVDDDRELRAMLRMTLEDAGYTVMEAAHGMQALSVLRDRVEPLVVVLDNTMPHLNGSYLLHLMAVDEGLLRHHRYILITGDTDTFTREVAPLRERLDARVLGKPFDLDEFSRAVAQAATELTTFSAASSPTATFEA